MRAWIFDSAARSAPEERATWLLHRFQGTVSDRQLKSMLVQVDVRHPGFAFPEAKVEVEAFGDEQALLRTERAGSRTWCGLSVSCAANPEGMCRHQQSHAELVKELTAQPDAVTGVARTTAGRARPAAVLVVAEMDLGVLACALVRVRQDRRGGFA
jgi:hypothetical protein